MSRIRFLSALMACVVAARFTALQSQTAAPLPTAAHWSVEGLPKHPVVAGAVFTLALAAHIEPGWHMYALEEPEGGPLPTQIGLTQGDPLTLLDVNGPEPESLPDPLTHAAVGLFHNSVRFALRLRAPRAKLPAGAMTHILVRYQACNDRVCLAPRTDTVAFPLSVLLK